MVADIAGHAFAEDALANLRAVTAENFVSARGLGDMGNLVSEAVGNTSNLIANVAIANLEDLTPGR